MRSGEDRRKADKEPSTEQINRRSTVDRRRANNNEYITFYVGDQFIGVPIYDVQEVLTAQTICPVPSSSKNIAGIINLRGQIVTVFNMHHLLEIESKDAAGDEEKEYMHVIVQGETELYSFQVDAVGDVVTIAKESLAPPPTNLAKQWVKCCFGIHHINNHMLAIIDKNPLIEWVKDDVKNIREEMLTVSS